MIRRLTLGLMTFLLSLSAQGSGLKAMRGSGLGDSTAIRPLTELLDDAGWTETPELSGVFKVGSIFRVRDGGHGLMMRHCFNAVQETDTYTSMEVVSQLQAGVSVRTGFFGAKASGEVVKRVRFGTPEHHTIERLAMEPTEDCMIRLAKLPERELDEMYAVTEVLTAEISEQTCGKVDAKGRFVVFGKAEAELTAACALESLEPVAVAMRTVPLRELIDEAVRPQTVVKSAEDCPWGGELSSLMVTPKYLLINGRKLDLRGAENTAKAVDEVHRCGHPAAARAIHKWQANRRTSVIAGYTLVGWYPLGIGMVAQLRANAHRTLTERLLRDPNAVPQRRIKRLMK